MAKHDELDGLLRHPKMTEDDWEFLKSFVTDVGKKEIERPHRARGMNVYIRHTCYGHAVSNLFREYYKPDYRAIVAASATKLKLTGHDDQSVSEIEHQILVELIKRMREQFIEEKGEAAWKAVEKEIEVEMRRNVAEGKFSAADADRIKGLGAGGLFTLLAAGRLSGFGVYMLANKLFFAVSRRLALGIGVAIAGPIIGRTLAFILGPAGWLLTGAWLVYDLGDTNWKKTISAIAGVAMLRRQIESR